MPVQHTESPGSIASQGWWLPCSHHWREVYVGESEVHIHPWLYGEFQASLGYIRPCLKMKTRNKQKKKIKNLGRAVLLSLAKCQWENVFPGGPKSFTEVHSYTGRKEAAHYTGRFTDLAVSQVTTRGQHSPYSSKLGHQEKGATLCTVDKTNMVIYVKKFDILSIFFKLFKLSIFKKMYSLKYIKK